MIIGKKFMVGQVMALLMIVVSYFLVGVEAQEVQRFSGTLTMTSDTQIEVSGDGRRMRFSLDGMKSGGRDGLHVGDAVTVLFSMKVLKIRLNSRSNGESADGIRRDEGPVDSGSAPGGKLDDSAFFFS